MEMEAVNVLYKMLLGGPLHAPSEQTHQDLQSYTTPMHLWTPA